MYTVLFGNVLATDITLGQIVVLSKVICQFGITPYHYVNKHRLSVLVE